MKKQLSAVLAVTMAFGMSMSAFAAEPAKSGDLNMDNNVANPILSYVVPTVVSYSIDAFGKLDGASGSQVYSGDLTFINKSDVNVSIKVKAKAVPKTGVTVAASPDKVNTDDYTNTAKELYLEAVVANTVAAASGATGATVDTVNKSLDIVEGKGAAKSVTLTTPGSTVGTPAKALITIDLEGVGAKTLAGETTGVVELLLKSGDVVLGKIVSGTVTIADTTDYIATDEEIVAAFDSTTVEIDGVIYDVAAATKKITLTAQANGGLAALTGGTATLQKPTGTPGTTAVDVTNVAKFGPTGPSDTTVGADTESKVTLASGSGKSMMFALEKATYVKPTTEQDATVFDSIGTTQGATSIRLMGKVNPVAAWADQDVKVTFSYDINPMSPSMYAAATTDVPAGYKAGLFQVPATTGTVAGTVAAADAKADGLLADYWDSTKLTIPVTEVAKDGTEAAVTIKTIQYRPDTTATTGAMLTSTDKTITDGKISIVPLAANATKIDNGGVVVVITFTDNNKVTLTLPKA